MNRKLIISLGPEIYLLCATIYYWSLTSNLFNPVALCLLGVLALLIVTGKVLLGIIVSVAIIMINLFFALAHVSEISEFSEPVNNFWNLLLVGSLFLVINLIMATLMLSKYIHRKMDTSGIV